MRIENSDYYELFKESTFAKIFLYSIMIVTIPQQLSIVPIKLSLIIHRINCPKVLSLNYKITPTYYTKLNETTKC